MSNKTEKTPRMMPHGKRQYLVTYSQLDEKLFPTRQSFGDMIAKEVTALLKFSDGPALRNRTRKEAATTTVQ